MPADDVIEACKPIAEANGCTIKLTTDVKDGVTGADVLYTDVWVSMGEPDEVWAERIAQLTPYRVTSEVMAMANPGAIFLHCLPSFHDTNTTTGADIAERFGARRWKSPTACSSPSSPRCSTRPRTACTPSRLSCSYAQVRASSISLGVHCCAPPSAFCLVKNLALSDMHGTEEPLRARSVNDL